MTANKVLKPKRPPSTNVLLDAMSAGLASVQGGMTDIDLADHLGWSPQSVGNVRNKRHLARLDIISSAAYHTDGAFIAPWLAALGLTVHPVDGEQVDHLDLAAMLADVSSALLSSLAPSSHGGSAVTAQERHKIANAARALLPVLTRLVADADGLKVAA